MFIRRALIYRKGKCERQISFLPSGKHDAWKWCSYVSEYSFQKQSIISLMTIIDCSWITQTRKYEPLFVIKHCYYILLSTYVHMTQVGKRIPGPFRCRRTKKIARKGFTFGILSAIDFEKGKKIFETVCIYLLWCTHSECFFWQCDITMQYIPLFEKSLSQLYKSRCCLEPA